MFFFAHQMTCSFTFRPTKNNQRCYFVIQRQKVKTSLTLQCKKSGILDVRKTEHTIFVFFYISTFSELSQTL